MAEVDAEAAEEDAGDALDCAAWAVDQAQLAVLDIVDARTRLAPGQQRRHRAEHVSGAYPAIVPRAQAGGRHEGKHHHDGKALLDAVTQQ